MDINFDINKIVNYLEKFKSRLPELYKWNANITRLVELEILTNQQIEELDQLTPYLKEIQLKKIVGKKLNEYLETNSVEFNKLCIWIIKDWGGIKAVKREETIGLLEEYLRVEKPKFNRIASTSKVGAYLYPQKNIIYDSRVAYSLNWIILSKNAGNLYFPIPEGRNSKMKAFDLNVLIRLKHISNFKINNISALDYKNFINKADSNLFINKDLAYFELNKLVRDIHNKLWKDEVEKLENLYHTEMLLFAIADREIFKDITDNLVLNTNVL